MSFQFWDPAVLSTMFHSSSRTGSSPANVPAFFQRPTKIVKPGSHNNSPRSTGRRRMTTTGHFPVRPRSVVDHQRTPVSHYTQQQQQQQQQPAARPISWHPNMMDDVNHIQMPYQPLIDNYMTTQYGTTEVNGLITPLSYPLVDEPQIHELITPLDELSANDSNVQHGIEQDFSTAEYWMSQPHVKDAQYDFSNGYLYSDINYQPWYTNNQHQIHNFPTAPASPNYIPMLDFEPPPTSSTLTTEAEKEELVGMGLYDSPAQVQTSALMLGSNIGPARRRYLKLEDAFEPSPGFDEEEDEDYAEDDDDALRNNHVDAGITGDLSDATILSAEYTRIMNNYPLMVNQWPMDSQGPYGWV